MEQYEVKRGLVKKMGPAGLAKLGAEYFDDVVADADGGFEAQKGIMISLSAQYNAEGKLVIDVEQMRGDDLSDFLSADGGRQAAMESRAAFSSFLDEATGYSPKQRGDKAKEGAKKVAKAKSAINQARKFMSMSKSVSEQTKAQAEELISEIEAKLGEGNATRAFSLSEKLGKLVEG